MFSKPMNDILIPYGIEIQASKVRNYILIALGLAPIIKGCFNIVYIFYKRRKDVNALSQFPGPPPHWYYGNIKDFTPGKAYAERSKLIEKYGDVYMVHLGLHYRQVLFGSAKAIQAIMSTPEPKDFAYNFLKPWIGEGLLVSNGKKWAHRRRLLTPAFHFDILKPYQELHSTSCNVLIDKWDKILQSKPEESLEMFEHMSLMAFDSLMKCIFGINGNYQNLGQKDPYVFKIYEVGDLVMQRFRNPLHHSDFFYYFSYNGYKFRKACDFIHTFSREVVKKKRNDLLLNVEVGLGKLSNRYIDFIDVLLTCRDSDGNGLCDEDIEAEVDTFMFEGHDTTASGLSWCLYNLAKHPEIQQKCREEVNQVLGDRTEVTWNDLNKLNFLTMCIKESLRISPPVPAVGRATTGPHTLYDGRVIPAQSFCILNIYSVHMNPDDWPNPQEFNPERFTIEASKDRHPYAFIPFSAGPRNCIGQHFVMNEIKTALALILKRFEVQPDPKNIPDPIQSLVLKATTGLYLKIKPV